MEELEVLVRDLVQYLAQVQPLAILLATQIRRLTSDEADSWIRYELEKREFTANTYNEDQLEREYVHVDGQAAAAKGKRTFKLFNPFQNL